MTARGRFSGFAVVFLIACELLACAWLLKNPALAWLRQGREPVAGVAGHAISRPELQQAIRDHLWRGGISWHSMSSDEQARVRSLILEQLINARLIRVARIQEGADITADIRRESEMLRRQFVDPAELSARLAALRHTPKSFDATILDAHLDEAWLAKKLNAQPVTEAEARAWYDSHKESLRIPQVHHAAHIFLAVGGNHKAREVEIRRIHRQLVAGEKSFAALALAHSEDDRNKRHGGDLGWFTRQRMPADFLAAVEKLQVGQFSGPVSTRLGWHIIRLLGRHPSRLPTFAEAKNEITALLTSRRREAALQSLLARLRQQSSRDIIYHTAAIHSSVPSP